MEAAPGLGTTFAPTMMIAIQKIPECPVNCSGILNTIFATTTKAENNASKIN
jgi:hypothetical protein